MCSTLQMLFFQLPSCVRLCDPMDCSMPGLPVPHRLLEFAQVHAHCIGDAIQPFHPITSSHLIPLQIGKFKSKLQ